MVATTRHYLKRGAHGVLEGAITCLAYYAIPTAVLRYVLSMLAGEGVQVMPNTKGAPYLLLAVVVSLNVIASLFHESVVSPLLRVMATMAVFTYFVTSVGDCLLLSVNGLEVRLSIAPLIYTYALFLIVPDMVYRFVAFYKKWSG